MLHSFKELYRVCSQPMRTRVNDGNHCSKLNKKVFGCYKGQKWVFFSGEKNG